MPMAALGDRTRRAVRRVVTAGRWAVTDDGRMHDHDRPRPLRSLLRVAVALAVAASLAACGVIDDVTTPDGQADAATSAPTSASSSAAVPTGGEATDGAQQGAVRVVVVGDSITAGIGPTDSALHPGDTSWLPGAQGAPLEFAGGWAVPGTTSPQMRDGVTPLDGDVLVLLAGTNDLQWSIPWDVTRDALVQIAATVGTPRTMLVAVPPLDSRPADAVTHNQRAAGLASEQGWEFVDPWTGIAGDGRFAPGTSADGIHPTPAAAAQAGARVREALLAGAGR